MHEENTRYFEYYVRILALNLFLLVFPSSKEFKFIICKNNIILKIEKIQSCLLLFVLGIFNIYYIKIPYFSDPYLIHICNKQIIFEYFF